jgi:hypothetical protein
VRRQSVSSLVSERLAALGRAPGLRATTERGPAWPTAAGAPGDEVVFALLVAREALQHITSSRSVHHSVEFNECARLDR